MGKRFKLEKVKITEVKEGKVTLELEGLYVPSEKNIRFDGVGAIWKPWNRDD